MAKRLYRLGVEFPYEGFVQVAIENYFKDLGFSVDEGGVADLACLHDTRGERWIVEAKGMTSSPGLDFRTGLGQLVQRMIDDSTKYGIAIPNQERLVYQCRSVSNWVRKQLGLYWLIVSQDQKVILVAPEEEF